MSFYFIGNNIVLNTYTKFTFNSIFRPGDFINKKILDINYIVTILSFCTCFYQSPLILTELFQHNLINVSYLTACYLYQVMMTLHFLMTSLMTLKQQKN